MTSLLQEGHSLEAVNYTSPTHPLFLQGVSTEHLMKLVRFGIWSKFMVEKTDKFKNISDVLKAELEVFSKSGYGIRQNFQVKFKFIFLPDLLNI